MIVPPKPTSVVPQVALSGLIIRSRIGDDNREDAWVSLMTTHVGVERFTPIQHWKAKKHGANTWQAAETYAQKLAADLGVPVRKKRVNSPVLAPKPQQPPKPLPKPVLTRRVVPGGGYRVFCGRDNENEACLEAANARYGRVVAPTSSHRGDLASLPPRLLSGTAR